MRRVKILPGCKTNCLNSKLGIRLQFYDRLAWWNLRVKTSALCKLCAKHSKQLFRLSVSVNRISDFIHDSKPLHTCQQLWAGGPFPVCPHPERGQWQYIHGSCGGHRARHNHQRANLDFICSGRWGGTRLLWTVTSMLPLESGWGLYRIQYDDGELEPSQQQVRNMLSPSFDRRAEEHLTPEQVKEMMIVGDDQETGLWSGNRVFHTICFPMQYGRLQNAVLCRRMCLKGRRSKIRSWSACQLLVVCHKLQPVVQLKLIHWRQSQPRGRRQLPKPRWKRQGRLDLVTCFPAFH